MAIFPEKMDKLTPADTKDSIEKIDRYIRYMVERIEFNNSNEVKRFGTADATSKDIVKMFLETSDAVALMRGEIQQLYNATVAATRQVGELNTTVANLTKRVETLENGTEG